MPLTVRGCPPALRQALKKSAAAHHRSLNGETLVWLEKQADQKVVTGGEAAAILRKFKKLLTPKEHGQMAEGIEEARRRMAHEHLH